MKSFILKLDVRSSMHMGLTCFCFSVFLTRLCQAGMRRAEAYACFWWFVLDKYGVVDPMDGEVDD